jgi:hypothetical protein
MHPNPPPRTSHPRPRYLPLDRRRRPRSQGPDAGFAGDEQVRKNFDPADLDLDNQAWHSACVPRERARTNRSSDDSCSYCQVLGVQTGFRFPARAYKQTFSGTVMIGLYAVVLRSFGQEGRTGREQPDEHWRCHGASERRLARFRNTWTPTPGNAPYVYPNDELEHL